MVPTLLEVRAHVAKLEHLVRCVYNDMQADPIYVTESYLRERRPHERRLLRLRERYYRGEELIAQYAIRIDELRADLKAFAQADKIKRLLRLMRKINDMRRRQGKKRKKQAVTELRVNLTQERYWDLHDLIAGYQHEIVVIQKLLANEGQAFYEKEKALIGVLRRHDDFHDRFVEHRLYGQHVLDQTYAELDSARKLVANMTTERTVQQLGSQLREMAELMAELGPETVATLQLAGLPIEEVEVNFDE